MNLLTRFSPVTRGNLMVAVIPLGVALIARGLAALEQHLGERVTYLAELEDRIAARTAELADLIGHGEKEPEGEDADDEAEMLDDFAAVAFG